MAYLIDNKKTLKKVFFYLQCLMKGFSYNLKFYICAFGHKSIKKESILDVFLWEISTCSSKFFTFYKGFV